MAHTLQLAINAALGSPDCQCALETIKDVTTFTRRSITDSTIFLQMQDEELTEPPARHQRVGWQFPQPLDPSQLGAPIGQPVKLPLIGETRWNSKQHAFIRSVKLRRVITNFLVARGQSDLLVRFTGVIGTIFLFSCPYFYFLFYFIHYLILRFCGIFGPCPKAAWRAHSAPSSSRSPKSWSLYCTVEATAIWFG